MAEALYTKATLKNMPVDFRIGAIISDGMWYSAAKWKKLARVTEEELEAWIAKGLADGSLIQSETGAKSYRIDHTQIKKWYSDNGISLNEQLVDFLFPPRIWGGMTETEGFLAAPLREIGIVSFSCATNVAAEVIEELRGVARVREDVSGSYKAYCLNASYAKDIISKVFKKHSEVDTGKIYSRTESKRREMVDFNREFAGKIIKFYAQFGQTLAKREQETIQIFLPEPEDQRSQMIMWVITAIEKFDESASVPFSGYLNSVLKRWPYDLPLVFLGKDLSNFQRERAKAITRLRTKTGEQSLSKTFSSTELAEEIGLSVQEFSDLEEKHRAWLRSQNATTLTWGETADERSATSITADGESDISDSDLDLASEMSYAAVQAALETGLFEDAFKLIAQIDTHSMDDKELSTLSHEYVVAFGSKLNG